MISLELSTQIHRPLSQVFAFITTPENDFQWQYGTLASERVSNGEVGEGTLRSAHELLQVARQMIKDT